MLKVWETFCLIAVVAKVDQYAEIEYSLVSSPTVSKSSIDFSLKVNNWTFYILEALETDSVGHVTTFLSLRVNFTTLGSIRSLRSPPHPFPCRPRLTACCTSACLPSPPTLLASSTTKLGPSACTSQMTWWASSSWFPRAFTFTASHWPPTSLLLCHDRSHKALP